MHANLTASNKVDGEELIRREMILVATREENNKLHGALALARQVAQTSKELEASELAEAYKAAAKEIRKIKAMSTAARPHAP